MGWHSSRQERGYGWEWRKLRLTILERDKHLCQCARCKASGRTTLATQVDHVVSKAKAQALGWTEEQIDDPSNLQAINDKCHEIKTKEEQGIKHVERVGFSKSGWPVW